MSQGTGKVKYGLFENGVFVEILQKDKLEELRAEMRDHAQTSTAFSQEFMNFTID